ncbi:abortive infection family protein [Pseudonocardia sichuanensis]
MKISSITRRNIRDEIILKKFDWAGRLSEVDFLARLYELSDLPSYDRRYKDAYGDIYQHRVNNDDWDDDWVFYDSRFSLESDDDALLAFLAETVHPVVRPDEGEARQVIDWYNSHLERDGYRLAKVGNISGFAIYAAQEVLAAPLALDQIAETVSPQDRVQLGRQITRMSSHIESDPDLAIGTAKELIETCCFTILDALGVSYERKWPVGKLVRHTALQLKVAPDDVDDKAKAADAIRQVLGSLAQIVQGVVEIRNAYGSGHGRSLSASGLTPRHARLVVGAASTLASFLFETYDYHYGEPPRT